MTSHDSIRSFAGTFLLALYLPVPVYMTWIHAGHGMWKRIGPASYVVHLALYAGMLAAIIRAHEIWRWHAWPWPAWISIAGVIPIAIAAYLAYETYRTIPVRTLLTFRQIRPAGERRLIRTGVLGKVRHPRYVMYAFLAAGNFCVTGYPLVLASVAVTVLFLAITIHLEERELRAHFGEEFQEYRRSVPAFFPRVPRVNRRKTRHNRG
jgi:protein-S-isoprenylcysteine O-methyltransferase Ste14